MKYFQFIKTLLCVAIAAISLSACKKVIVPEDTGTKGQKIVSFITYGSLEAAPYAASSLIVDLSKAVESQEYYLKYSGPTVLPNDMTITVAYDDAALTAFNANAAASGGLVFTKLPSNFYKIINPTIKIPAGTAISEALKIDIYANMLDPAVSYMFPITITAISGGPSDVKKGAGTGTAYFHIIGNPLAGPYKRSFYRWNGTTDTTTAPNSTVTLDELLTIAPVTATSLLLPESYIQTFVGSYAGVTLNFTNTGGVLSNPVISLNSATLNGLAGGGFTVISAPKLVQASIVGNASTKYAGTTFRVYTVLQNSTPAIRTLIDQFVKQ